jgi:hypothetical protein
LAVSTLIILFSGMLKLSEFLNFFFKNKILWRKIIESLGIFLFVEMKVSKFNQFIWGKLPRYYSSILRRTVTSVTATLKEGGKISVCIPTFYLAKFCWKRD